MTIKNVIVRLLLDLKVDLLPDKARKDNGSSFLVCKADHSIYGVGMFKPTKDVRIIM